MSRCEVCDLIKRNNWIWFDHNHVEKLNKETPFNEIDQVYRNIQKNVGLMKLDEVFEIDQRVERLENILCDIMILFKKNNFTSQELEKLLKFYGLIR